MVEHPKGFKQQTKVSSQRNILNKLVPSKGKQADFNSKYNYFLRRSFNYSEAEQGLVGIIKVSSKNSLIKFADKNGYQLSFSKIANTENFCYARIKNVEPFLIEKFKSERGDFAEGIMAFGYKPKEWKKEQAFGSEKKRPNDEKSVASQSKDVGEDDREVRPKGPR